MSLLQSTITSSAALKKTSANYLSGGTFVRLLLSLMVVGSHFCGLTALYKNRYFDSNFAVGGFFILSGFAMMNSYERLTSRFHGKIVLRKFYIQRFFRVVIPVWILVLAQIILFFFFSNLSLIHYLFSGHLLKYTFANFSFLNFIKPDLPGVYFERTNAINGSLWTLKIELQFYALFPLLYWLMAIKKIKWVIPLLWLFFIAITFFFNPPSDLLLNQLPGQFNYFFSGIMLYQLRPLIKGKAYYPYLKYIGLFMFMKMFFVGYSYLESSVYFPLVVLSLCDIFTKTESAVKGYDYSFTLYLIHWPIFKMASALFFDQGKLLPGIAFVLIVITISGYLLHRVELWAIRLGHRYSS